MGVSDGNSCGRVIQAYRAADIALEGCWSYMPRKCHCLEDALSMAHEAMVHGRHASFEGLRMHDGVKHRCLDGNQTLTSRTAQETARKKRRLNVGPVWVAQVWEQGGRKGAFTGLLSGFLGGVAHPSRPVSTFLEAVIMPSGAHQLGGKVRALESLRSETMSDLLCVSSLDQVLH